MTAAPTAAPDAGEVMAVAGAPPFAPPGLKAYRNPSLEVTKNVPSDSAGDAEM